MYAAEYVVIDMGIHDMEGHTVGAVSSGAVSNVIACPENHLKFICVREFYLNFILEVMVCPEFYIKFISEITVCP